MSELLGLTTQLQVTIPSPLETDWATSIRNNCFQKIVEHDHTGVSGKGIKIATAAISDDAITGAKIRLDNNEYLKARNAANSANKSILKVNASDEVEFGTTVGVIDLQDDGLTISDNADNTKKIALNASNITTGTTRTISAPDATGTIVLNDNTATLTNKTIDADSNTITNIENADIKSGAAIAVDKLAALTASRALASDGSGVITPSSTTSTELGYVSGVTSAIQTQLNAKAPTASPTFSGTITTPVTASRALITNASSELAASATTDTELGYVSGVTSAIQTQINAKLTSPLTTNGDILYYNSGHQRLPKGTDGQVLQLSSGLPTWTAAPAATDSVVEITNADSPYTALTSTQTLLVDATSGAVTVNLYAVSGNAGKKINIIKTDSSTNAVTIDGNSTETIDGNTTRILRTQYESREIQVNNSANAWFTINRKNTTPWASYTPSTNGLGSTSEVSVRWKRIGDTVFVTGRLRVGTVTAAEAQINLPNSYTISSNMSVEENIVGHLWEDASSNSVFSVIATASDGFVNISYHNNSAANNGLSPQLGNALFTSNGRISFTFQVEVNELQD